MFGVLSLGKLLGAGFVSLSKPLLELSYSAAGLAGLIKKKAQRKLPKGKVIVITVTGNGLKDVQWVLNGAGKPIVIPVDLKRAAKVIGLK